MISTQTIGEAWVQSIKLVMETGSTFFDEDVTIKELLGLTVSIEAPALQDEIVSRFGDPYIIEHTLQKFEKGVVMSNRPFTYGERIYNKNGVDQFEWMIDRLQKKPESKSATISLLTDGSEDANLPCLVVLDAKIRSNRLWIQFFFRSQNIVGRQYANLLAISKFQHKMANRLGIEIGPLAGYIASAHIYEYDFNYAEEICNNKNIVLKDRFYDFGPKSIRCNTLFK